MNEQKENRIETDVLIIGGGIAGLFAAVKAKEKNASLRVLLVDKCYPGASGSSVFAAGVLPNWQPGDEFENYVREIVEDNSEYLIDQDYVSLALKESYDRFLDLVKYGVEFQRDENGEVKRIPALSSRFGKCTPYEGGVQLTWKVRSEGVKRGVKNLDRVFITDLLMKDGVCCGAVGFHILSGEFFVINSRATIIATGSIFFSRTQMGTSGTTGDGMAAAFRAGAQIRNAEQLWATVGPASMASPGLHVLFGNGGILVNSKGERFMEKYNPLLLEEARRFETARAILNEWREGRGPCWLDCRHLPSEKLNMIKTSLPLFTAGLKKMEIDLAADRIEFVPYGLSLLHTGGIRINDADGDVGIPGLWVVGGAGDYCGGAESTTATTLTGSSVQGARAGLRAAEYAGGLNNRVLDEKQVRAMKANVFKSLHNKSLEKSFLRAEEVYTGICRIILRHVNLFKDENMLQKAVKEIHNLKEEFGVGGAVDIRGLQKVHEVKNMLQLAEVIARSSLLRTESRSAHFRMDFPQRDDINWLKWVVARANGDGIDIWTEDIPISR
ncbi:MAG: FAD-binding protein, partial [Dehalococcoidia bacterium]|nr:FAD-binding protein [Dehalococcoidia bacterium]